MSKSNAKKTYPMLEIDGLKRKLSSKLASTALQPDWQVIFCNARSSIILIMIVKMIRAIFLVSDR